MGNETWNPSQYDKFKAERSRPFWDLADLVRWEGVQALLDLGCGTGELTQQLHQKRGLRETLAIDNSASMLEVSHRHSYQDLQFENADIQSFGPRRDYDVIFSNAALQWLPEHQVLFPKILGWLKPRGQVAIQMPYNFDHPSHQIAREVAGLFPELQTPEVIRPVLNLETYAEILFHNGFQEQKCRIEVYMHPMKSGADVVEWTRGTLLTAYRRQLTPRSFERFLELYRQKLIQQIGERPYVYTFKRLLLWGQKNA